MAFTVHAKNGRNVWMSLLFAKNIRTVGDVETAMSVSTGLC